MMGLAPLKVGAGAISALSETSWVAGLATACMIVVCTSCAARQRGPDEPLSGEAWVRDVKIAGEHSLDDDDILEGLASQSPRGWIIRRRTRLDEDLIARDRVRIETYYRLRGFFDVHVTGVDVKAISKEKSDIIFRVVEGKRSKLSAISVEGLPPELSSAGKIDHGLKVGQGFDHERFAEAKTTILATLLRHGYAHAEVEGSAEVDKSKHDVALRYTVVSGPQVRFGTIDIRGLKTIPESAVTNRLTLRTGELFHPRAIARSQSDLRGLGRFGVVRIDFADKSESAVGNMVVTVTEAPSQEVRLGGGLGFDRDNFEVRSRAEYTRHGLVDPLTSFSAQVRPAYALVRSNLSQGELVGEASTSLTREDLLWPLGRGRVTLAYDLDALEAYSSRGGNALVSFSRPLWRQKIQVSAGWRLELLEFTRIDDAIDDSLRRELGFTTPYRAGFFEQTLALDLRDQPLNADDGVYAQIKLEEGGAFAGGTFDYARLSPEVRAYHALSERFGLAGRAKLGLALWGSLPVTRRFFSGGSTSHRGFSQRRLSPVAGEIETSDIGIGGDKLLELVVETRFSLFKAWEQWVGLTFFADGGDVVLDKDALDPSNLHWALGSGLRYDTLIGPIRFDLGYRVTRFGAGEIQSRDRLAFHFSIGEAF